VFDENEIDAETACQGESDDVKLTYIAKDLFNIGQKGVENEKACRGFTVDAYIGFFRMGCK
jgi:hypothetical protein